MITDISLLENALKKNISQKRMDHTLRVMETALHLSEIHGADKEKTKIAALLHDFAKNMKKDELLNLLEESGEKILPLEKAEAELLHGPAAAIIARRDFGIEDHEILESIKYHTTGNPGLSNLAKIIYLADAIEPSREYPGISEIRKAAEKDLDKAFLMSLNSTLEFLIPRGRLIHPASIEARNEILLKRKLNEE